MTDKLRTESGAPVADNQNSQTAGPRGPVLLQDQHLLEKLARFNRERIPERVVHAVGSGAHGHFEVTNPDVARFTRMQHVLGARQAHARSSRASRPSPGSKGAPDTVRDPRGFALKFYTEDGNWDLAGNNTPIFFIRDPLKFPDFIHSQKYDPYTQRAGARERLGLLLALARDHAPVHLALRRPRHPGDATPHGRLRLAHLPVGERGGRALLGEVPLQDRPGHPLPHERGGCAHRRRRTRSTTSRTCARAIERGEFPSWTLKVQVMPEADARDLPLQPVRPHQGLALRGLPADRGRPAGARPQPGQLLRRRRAGRLRSGPLRAGHRALAGQDAAGAALRVRRRAPLPARREPHAAPGQRAARRRRRRRRTTGATARCASTANGGRAKNYEPNSFDGPRQTGEPLYAGSTCEALGGAYAPVRHAEDDDFVAGRRCSTA